MMPMKGLLKGLRYISQIFDNEKEEEIQIGLPTDVKHVAHIGMDGPSANTPSWMNKYSANSETTPTSENGESKRKPPTKLSTEDPIQWNIRESQSSSSGTLDSPTQRNSSKARQSRRNNSTNSLSESANGDSFKLSKPRRQKHIDESGSPKTERTRRNQNQCVGSESLSNPLKVPKSRRKKSKESGNGSKGTDPFHETSTYSDPGPDPRFKNKEVHGERDGCDEIARGFHAL